MFYSIICQYCQFGRGFVMLENVKEWDCLKGREHFGIKRGTESPVFKIFKG